MGVLYHRVSDRLTGTWTSPTGTPRTGYGASNVQSGDPSTPYWVTGTSFRLVCDLGSAKQVDEVYVFGHNLSNSAGLHIQLNASNTWSGPDCDVAVTIPTPYEDGFTYNVRASFKTAYPTAGNRTKRYVSLYNASANAATCYIGEVWIATTTRTFSGVRYGFSQLRTRIASPASSKKGVVTMYDYGSYNRSLSLEFPFTDAEYDDARSLEIDAHGPVYGFPIVLDDGNAKARFAEPMYVRFLSSLTNAPYQFTSQIPAKVELGELGIGSTLGA